MEVQTLFFLVFYFYTIKEIRSAWKQSFCLFILWLTLSFISTDCSNNYLIFFASGFVILAKKLSVVTFFPHSVNGNNVSSVSKQFHNFPNRIEYSLPFSNREIYLLYTCRHILSLYIDVTRQSKFYIKFVRFIFYFSAYTG